jgi:hypothetical protein
MTTINDNQPPIHRAAFGTDGIFDMGEA